MTKNSWQIIDDKGQAIADSLKLTDKDNKYGKSQIVKNTVTGFTTVALGILLAKDGLAKESPKYKGSLVDQIKISQVTKQKLGEIHILPNGNAYNAKTGEIYKVEADSGKIGNDASKKQNPFGEYKIDSDYLDVYNTKFSSIQKNKVLSRFGEAQKNKKLNNENIVTITERWIMYYHSLNQNALYIQKSLKKEKISKDFDLGEGLYSVLKEIKKISPEMITQNDLTEAQNFDKEFNNFVEEEGKKVKEEGKKVKELIKLLEKFK